MKLLSEAAKSWGKASDLKKLRITLMILWETEPLFRVFAIVLHAAFIGLGVSLFFAGPALAREYVFYIVALGVFFALTHARKLR